MKSKAKSVKNQRLSAAALSNMLLLLISAAYSIVVLYLNSRYCCDALILSLVPCVSTVVILLGGLKKPKIEKGDSAFIHLISLLFMLMLSFIDIVKNTVNRLTENTAMRVVVGIAFFATIYFCTCFLLRFVFALFMKERKLSKPLINSDKPYTIYVVIIAVATILFLVAAGYGYDSPDTITIYSYYKDKGIWFDWHTISYEMFMALCMKIIPNAPFVFSLILVQSVLWIVVSSYAIKSLYNAFNSISVVRVYTALSLIIFTPIYYSSLGIKDPMFSMSVYAFSISIFNLLRTKEPGKKEYILLCVTSVFASLFRHTAVECVALSLFALMMYRMIKYKDFKRLWRYLAISLVPAIGFVGITVGIGDFVLHKYKNVEYVKYTTPIYLSVACADKLGDDFGEENKAVLEKIMPLDEWIDCYNEDIYWTDTVTKDWGGIGEKVNDFDAEFYKGVIDINADMVLHHPLVYSSLMFRTASIVWRIGNPADCNAFYPSGKGLAEYELYRPSVAGKIIPSIIDFSVDNVFSCAVLWRGGIWIFAALCASYVLIKKRKAEYLWMILPIVLFAALLFICNQAQDPRFILSFIEVGMIYAIIAFYTKNEKPQDEKS